MGSFVHFMQSAAGRLLRVVAGVALIALGLGVVKGTGGIILAVVGVVPLVAGLAGVCLIGALFGYTLGGQPRGHRAS